MPMGFRRVNVSREMIVLTVQTTNRSIYTYWGVTRGRVECVPLYSFVSYIYIYALTQIL